MRKIFLYCLLVFCIAKTSGQSVRNIPQKVLPEDILFITETLGKPFFNAFKNNSFVELSKYRLAANEVSTFLTSVGIDTSSERIKRYVSKYPDVTAAFFQICTDIETDTIKYPVWKNAELISVHLKNDGNLFGPDAKETDSSSLLYLADIIRCGDKQYLLSSEIFKYNGKWLLGNIINCLLTDGEISGE